VIDIHNKDLNDLNGLNVIRVIKSRIMRWEGHVAPMGGRTSGGRGEVHTRFRWGNVRERDHLDDPGVDGKLK
jgi:hypothetical protein